MNINSYTNYFYIIISFLVAIVFSQLYMNIAPSRDFGYYATLGSEFLEGIFPYLDYDEIHAPGLTLIFACLIYLFGKSLYPIFIVNILLKLSYSFAVYRLGSLWNNTIGKLAGIIALFIIYTPTIGGYSAYSVNNCLLLSILTTFSSYAFLRGFKNNEFKINNFFLIGIILGIALLIRQTVVFTLITIVLINFFISSKNKITNTVALCVAFFIPLLLLCLFFYKLNISNGIFLKSLFFSPDRYEPQFNAKAIFLQWVMLMPIWCLLATSITKIVLQSISSRQVTKDMFLILWLFLSSYVLTVRQYHQYYIELFPSISILCAIALKNIVNELRLSNIKKYCYLNVFIGILLLSVILLSSLRITSFYIGYSGSKNMSLNLLTSVGNYIKKHTHKNDRIFVFPAKPQIYFFSDRKPATSILEWERYTNQKVQEKIIASLKKNSVQYVIVEDQTKNDNNKGLYDYTSSAIYNYIVDKYYLDEKIGNLNIYKLHTSKPKTLK